MPTETLGLSGTSTQKLYEVIQARMNCLKSNDDLKFKISAIKTIAEFSAEINQRIEFKDQATIDFLTNLNY